MLVNDSTPVRIVCDTWAGDCLIIGPQGAMRVSKNESQRLIQTWVEDKIDLFLAPGWRVAE